MNFISVDYLILLIVVLVLAYKTFKALNGDKRGADHRVMKVAKKDSCMKHRT